MPDQLAYPVLTIMLNQTAVQIFIWRFRNREIKKALLLSEISTTEYSRRRITESFKNRK